MHKSEQTQWWRFRKWFVFLVIICVMALVIQTLVKIPQRWSSPDLHWLTGEATLAYFISLRLGILAVLPVTTAALCSFSNKQPPSLFPARSDEG